MNRAPRQAELFTKVLGLDKRFVGMRNKLNQFNSIKNTKPKLNAKHAAEPLVVKREPFFHKNYYHGP